MNTAQNTSFGQSYVLAKIESRFMAALIDYAIYFCFVYYMAVNYGAFEKPESYNLFSVTFTGPAALFVLIGWLFIPITEWLFGQTIGKFLLKIQVLTLEGKKATFRHCMVRHILDIADSVPVLGIMGLMVSAKTPDRQRIGDIVAGTFVVNR